MTIRQPLPNRRRTITESRDWCGRPLIVSVGIDDHGVVREVFADHAKSGSDADASLDDSLVVVSLALQSGWSIGDILRHLGREGTDVTAPAASVLGYAIEIAAGMGV